MAGLIRCLKIESLKQRHLKQKQPDLVARKYSL